MQQVLNKSKVLKKKNFFYQFIDNLNIDFKIFKFSKL